MNGIRLSITLLLLSIGGAQTLTTVRGRVEGNFTFLGNEYTIELQSRSQNGPAIQASVANDGSFEFRDVAGGQYNLRLTNARGDVLNEQIVDAFHYSGMVSIQLPAPRASRPISGTVSFRELQRPVPPKALQAFVEAQRYAESGHERDAVRKLERALQIYPDYSDARCNLGVEYVRLGRWPEALEQFQKALASGPPSARLFANLAYSLCSLGRLKDGEQAARRAVELDNSYTRGHYLLGSILAKSVTPASLGRAPEAASHLRLGANDVPHAYLDIARIYLMEGDQLGAAEEVRLYLRCGDKGYRAEAERWLKNIIGN